MSDATSGHRDSVDSIDLTRINEFDNEPGDLIPTCSETGKATNLVVREVEVPREVADGHALTAPTTGIMELARPVPIADIPFQDDVSDDVVPVSLTNPLPDRSLPALADLSESRRDRWIWICIMLAVAAMYAFTLFSLWAPADGGVDQNAYLLGGRQLAVTGKTTRFIPPSPYGYVGRMNIVPKDGPGYYPKYPVGLPLLFAVALKVFGMQNGVAVAFAISPICAILTLVGVFMLARELSSSFAALLAAIAFATCQVMWELANASNSHASCVAFVVWGMFFLLRWWQTDSTSSPWTGSIWRGILAGFFLGYAATIRYTEGLLVLPIVAAVLFRIRWRNWRSYLRNVTPLLAWSVPVVALLIFNKLTIGDWTGYDNSNESEFGAAFTWAKFADTWEQMVRTFHDQGLFFITPLGLAGLLMLFARNWRLAIAMLAWLLPGTALYTSYYWSPDRGIAYARFFLTVFPALTIGLAVLIRHGIMDRGDSDDSPRRSIALPIAAGLIVAIASGVASWRALHGSSDANAGGPPGMGGESLASQFLSRLAIAQAGQVIHSHVPDEPDKPSILICEEGRQLSNAANYLQFAGGWSLYTMNSFDSRGGRWGMLPGAMQDANNPSPMQPRRREVEQKLFAGKSEKELVQAQHDVVDKAFSEKRKVFLAGTRSAIDNYVRTYFPKAKYNTSPVDRWRLPPAPVGFILPAQTGGSMFGGRRGGGGGMRGGRGGGPAGPGGAGPGGPAGGPGGAEMPTGTEWQLFEVTLVPPKAPPATLTAILIH